MSSESRGESSGTGPLRGAWDELTGTPLRMRLYLALVAVAALVLPWAVPIGLRTTTSVWVTVLTLVGVSVLNVEISRWLTGGLSTHHQPHKALSAWAFACALLLPTPWLLLVVPLAYLHARWRGLRVTLWKWARVRLLPGAVRLPRRCRPPRAARRPRSTGCSGQGGEGMLGMLAAGAAFLALETLLFVGSATLNHAEDEVWLKATLRSPAYYATETGVLLVGGLLSAVWTGGPWFSLFFVPVYVLVQHAVLLVPLRERAETAEVLAEKNRALAAANEDLQQANEFKVDLLGMLGHELGNPLTAVSGFADHGALERGPTRRAGGSRRAFEVVGRNADQMRAVLDDILAWSPASGALTAVPERCLLPRRLEQSVAGLPRAGRRRRSSAPSTSRRWCSPATSTRCWATC